MYGPLKRLRDFLHDSHAWYPTGKPNPLYSEWYDACLAQATDPEELEALLKSPTGQKVEAKAEIQMAVAGIYHALLGSPRRATPGRVDSVHPREEEPHGN